jgi:hypothetical protein
MTENTNGNRFVDNKDGTVTDTLKNHMWMKSDTWVELGHLLSYEQSQEYVKEINDKNFAGYSDWRIPNATLAKELYDTELSNIDVEGGEVHIDPVFTSGCGYTTWTTETRGAKSVMGYDYRSDYEYWLAKNNVGFPSAVRLVRIIKKQGSLSQEERFINHKNGTISDHETGLMWRKDDSYLAMDKWISWEEAKIFIQELNKEEVAGHTDWRMPTRKEAATIFDEGNTVTDNYGDTLYLPSAFPPGAGQTSWTKSVHKSDLSLAVRFNFQNGDYKWHKKGLRSHGVRPVRNFK